MRTRNLKIEETGDFAKGEVVPKIRLCGQWLERAGFMPGQRVEVVVNYPGALTLHVIEARPTVPAMPASLAAISPVATKSAMRRHAQRLGCELLAAAAEGLWVGQ